MDNKVLVNLFVPEIGNRYDVYLPINKKIGNIVILLNKAINEITNGNYKIDANNLLYNVETKQLYNSDILLANTDIRNGTKLLLIS